MKKGPSKIEVLTCTGCKYLSAEEIDTHTQDGEEVLWETVYSCKALLMYVASVNAYTPNREIIAPLPQCPFNQK